MFDAILNNHLLLAVIVLVFLWAVPAYAMRGRKLRKSGQPDRRKVLRPGIDRRA